MTADLAREFICVGFFMLLALLRLEADRFGTAEYDTAFRKRTSILSWLAWYAIGAAFLAAIYVLHPRPHDELLLLIGHQIDVLLFGVPLAALGAVQAVAYARYRYGYLRLPPIPAYPRAVINSIGTAVIDEATFRGILLGSLVWVGFQNSDAIAISTVSYLLVTRLAAPGRRHYMLLPATAYGVVGGWVTLTTGGIGAAIGFHAVTSFAMFLSTGHAGQPAPIGREPEEVAARGRVPAGWRVAVGGAGSGRGPEPLTPGWAASSGPARGESKPEPAEIEPGASVVGDRRRPAELAAALWCRARDGIGRAMRRAHHA